MRLRLKPRHPGLPFLIILLSGCTQGAELGDTLPRGPFAYQALAVTQTQTAQVLGAGYRILPLDTIDVTVFQEPELSVKAVPVDSAGNISLPLIGNVAAGGKTTPQLSGEIASRLGQDLLVNPQVSVVVTAPVAQKIVVQGEVVEPGIYPIEGATSLMEAVSLAKGETRLASLREVAVFRTVNGQRMGAIFDLESIRRGEAEDPQLLSNDIVVVGYSRSKGFWNDIRSTVPLVNIFRVF